MPSCPGGEVNLIEKLNTKWLTLEKPQREMARALGQMNVGVNRYSQDPIGASQAVLVTFQKVLDPTSVVRESSTRARLSACRWSIASRGCTAAQAGRRRRARGRPARDGRDRAPVPRRDADLQRQRAAAHRGPCHAERDRSGARVRWWCGCAAGSPGGAPAAVAAPAPAPLLPRLLPLRRRAAPGPGS